MPTRYNQDTRQNKGQPQKVQDPPQKVNTIYSTSPTVFAPDSQEPESGHGRMTNTGEVQGIILAGAHAWGDHILEDVACGPMVPIAARPLICHTLDWFFRGGICRASICANSDTAVFRRRLGDGRSLNISLDYYEDVMPRGPAGCVRDVAAPRKVELFIVVDGTVIPWINLQELVDRHRISGAVLTVVASKQETSESCSESVLQPTGIYVFSQAALQYVSPRGYQDIKETLIPRLHAEGLAVNTYATDDWSSVRVTNSASYLAANKWAVELLCREKTWPAEYRRAGEAWIHKSAHVDPSVRFIGPVLIEAGCVIEARSIIVGPTVVGAGCIVERDTVLSRSALWTCCRIGAGAILDHCVLTDGFCIEPRLVIRNTVCVPHMRKSSGLSEGLGSYIWPGKDRTGVSSIKQASRREKLRVAASGPRPPDSTGYESMANVATGVFRSHTSAPREVDTK